MAVVQFLGDGPAELVVESGTVDSTVSKPTKRMRWATQRQSGGAGIRKRMSILKRHRRPPSAEEKRSSSGTPDPKDATVPDDGSGAELQSESRRIFVNVPIPDDAKNEDGGLKEHFLRNKIRTAKYTPLSFVPKNLWFQFHNIANIYFFFIIILSIFSIFGATNPGLGAIPLIVILFVTAVKDGIEDWRRTVLDNELNNSPIHRLVDWNNVNSSEDSVGLWRRIKKASTKFIVSAYKSFKTLKAKNSHDSRAYAKRSLDAPRISIETTRSIQPSGYSRRASARSVQARTSGDGIQMTPLASPGLSAPHADPRLSRPGSDLSFYEDAKEQFSPTGTIRPKPYAVQNPKLERDHGSIINPSKTIPGRARFKKDYWKNVQVGDFVRIYGEEQIPADVVILSTSDPDGACYIETKNLDGETNLKVRQALQCGRRVRHPKDCERAEFTIESEGPHPNLYNYSAVIRWDQVDSDDPSQPPREMAEPISINNLLLRGCSLKNTDWILGVVVFTGLETKIMLNSGITPSKRAQLAKGLNWNVIYNFIILFVMCLVSGIVQGVTWSQGNNSLDYFEFGSIGGSPPVDGFVTFWSAIVLFQNLVPISLYISLEIIRTAQAFFIYSDSFMYYEKLDYPCTPKSWNISDDLGQIEYIFSDKTGTLTQNVMEFKKCTVNGVPYGEAYTEAQAGMRKREGVNVEEESARINGRIAQDRITMLHDLRELHDNPYLHDENLTFIAPNYVTDLRGQSGEVQQAACEHFMLALALCHTVITERVPGDPPKIEFKAQSPDEAALVATARDCGFTVLGRHNDNILLNVLGKERSYQILNTLEFNSTRKRMSAIVRMPDGKITLFCKGADSMIYSRLRRGEQQELRKMTAEHLEVFAREGLRTLCIAEKNLTEEEYQEWNKDHDLAAQALVDRDDRLEEVSDRMERDLMLLGGTAIEDRLQDGVPDTIALLGDAGIKLWVLTGDKVETAINIGFSCNLLANDMELIVLKVDESSDPLEEASAELDKHLKTFNLTGSDEELAAARKNHEPPDPTHAIVIDGDTLKLVLHDELRQRFLLLCKNCKSVLCCRVSPAQKAAVVQLVRTGLEIVALAIGDGANDVAMIQEANVGVGIAGEEGRQAVMSSDYAIGQFRFLQRLVLVHGRWDYRRLAETIANFFYKNMVWTFALFWYGIYNNFDITYLFEYTYILLVNLAFSSLPVILLGILDQDVSDKVSLAVPQLYRRGMERMEWSQRKFWLYMADGIYQSLIVFFIAYLEFAPATFVTPNGRDVSDRSRQGIYVAHAAVIVMNTYVLLNTYRWDWLILLVTAISTLLIFLWTGVYSAFTGSFQFYKAAPEVYGTLSFWAITLLSVIICLLPRIAAKFSHKYFTPQDVDIIREQVIQGKFKYLDGIQEIPVDPKEDNSASSSDSSAPSPMPSVLGKSRHRHQPSTAESQRPFYPPSVANTVTTRNPRSHTGSDETYRTKPSFDNLARRPSMDRVRSSFDRSRMSMDRLRPSFESSRDFTSAALLSRIESRQSCIGSPTTPQVSRRREDITHDLK